MLLYQLSAEIYGKNYLWLFRSVCIKFENPEDKFPPDEAYFNRPFTGVKTL